MLWIGFDGTYQLYRNTDFRGCISYCTIFNWENDRTGYTHRPNHDIPAGYPVCTKVARAQLIGQRRFVPWFGPTRPGYTQLCYSFLQIVPSWLGPVPSPVVLLAEIRPFHRIIFSASARQSRIFIPEKHHGIQRHNNSKEQYRRTGVNC